MKEEKKGTEKRQLRKIDRQALMQSGWTGGLGTGPDDCMPYDKYVELDDRGVISGSIYVCGLGWFTPGITIYGSGSGSGSYGCGCGSYGSGCGSYGCGSSWESGSNWGSEWGSWGSIDWGSNWGSGSDWGSGSGNGSGYGSFTDRECEEMGMAGLSKMRYDLQNQKTKAYEIIKTIDNPVVKSISIEYSVREFVFEFMDKIARDKDHTLTTFGGHIVKYLGHSLTGIGILQSIIALSDGEKTLSDWIGASSSFFGVIAYIPIPAVSITAKGLSMVLGLVAIATEEKDYNNENANNEKI